MSNLILKWKMADTPSLSIPWFFGSRVLHVAAQNPADTLPTIWVLYPEWTEDMPMRTFFPVGTGMQFDPDDREFIGSAICANGRLVWHVFAWPVNHG